MHIPVIQTRDKNQDLVSQTLHQDQEAVQKVSLSQIVDLITITIMTMLEVLQWNMIPIHIQEVFLWKMILIHNIVQVEKGGDLPDRVI